MESFLVQDRYLELQLTQSSGLNLDSVSDHILQRNLYESNSNAVISTGDGDCLFNSVSIHMVGNESLSLELRYKTCLEMVLNEGTVSSHKSRASLLLLSPDYNVAARNCARIGQFSSVWTMIALCNVIKVPIKSLYPCLNGSKDLPFMKLNQTFQPTGIKSGDNKEPIRVMWTHTQMPRKGKTWTPNHFVPVVNSSQVNSSKPPAAHVTPPQKPKVKAESTPIEQLHKSPTSPESPASPLPNITTPKKRVHDTSSSSDDLSFASPIGIVKPRVKRMRFLSSPGVVSDDSSLDHSTDESPFSCFNRYTVLKDEEVNIPQDKIEVELKKLPAGDRYMTVGEAFSTILGADDTNSVNKIPRGRKQNVYVILKNVPENARDFTDDCGVWGSMGTSVNSQYTLENGKLKNVPLKNGMYCTEKKIEGKRTYVPLQPQPGPNDIVNIHRYYAKLRENEAF